VRELARGSGSVPDCLKTVLKRREWIAGRFTLPAAIRIAERRLASMDQFLAALDEESAGIF